MGWIEALNILDQATDIYLKVTPGIVGSTPPAKKTQADLVEEVKNKIPSYAWVIGGVAGVILILLIMKYVR